MRCIFPILLLLLRLAPALTCPQTESARESVGKLESAPFYSSQLKKKFQCSFDLFDIDTFEAENQINSTILEGIWGWTKPKGAHENFLSLFMYGR